ncbi:hypothetical protein [Paracoccus sp. AK26]|uniref:hypothetical protein n=1 Tax=Paracoccus sp. AK26 TaxID=2589076 RepID=UPI0014314BE3|nr:hypothetical protein [Paracoccus sp. AK26]
MRKLMMVTAPATAVTATVGASGSKLIAKTVAKKASSQLAAKVAAKGAVKSGSVLTGAGAGATVCSFAGPAAVACGAGGALVAWIAVDAAVINIDELLNRDEFDADLRAMVDTERQRVKDTLRQTSAQRAGELQRVAPQQARDMTLDQLSRPERQDVCSRAQQLMSEYALIQTQLAAREPTSLAAFAADLDATEGDQTLAPMVQAMRSAIAGQGSRLQVENVSLKGNFRHDDRVDRDVSAQLQLQDTAVALHGRASVDYGFYLQTMPGLTLDLTRDIVARVAVEQHLRIRSNRFFGGEVQIRELLSDLGHAQGLRATWTAPVQIVRDPDADGLADTGVSPGPAAPITLTLRLAGVPLPDVLPLTSCTVPETVTLTQEAAR